MGLSYPLSSRRLFRARLSNSASPRDQTQIAIADWYRPLAAVGAEGVVMGPRKIIEVELGDAFFDENDLIAA